MSSSTSISNQSPARDRRLIAVFFATLAICLGAVAALNYRADPYDAFDRGVDVAARFGPKTNHALATLIEASKVPAAYRRTVPIAIFGDSRARSLTPGRTGLVGDRPLLNLGIGGASFEEMLTCLDRYAPRLPGVKTIVLTVPLERFAAAPRPDRCLEAAPLAASRLPYLLSWDMLRLSVGLLRTPPASIPTARPKPQQAAARDADVQATWLRMFREYEPARAAARLTALRRAVARLQERQIDVILWCPPLSPEIVQQIAACGLTDERQQLAVDLQKIARLEDMTAAPGAGDQPFEFFDPVHTRNGELILQRLVLGATK